MVSVLLLLTVVYMRGVCVCGRGLCICARVCVQRSGNSFVE